MLINMANIQLATKFYKIPARDIVQRANKSYKEILATAPDSLIDPALEEELEAYIKSGVPF